MSLLVLTNNTSSININPPEVITLEIGLTPAGARGLHGLQGEQGEKGDPFLYADFTAEQLALLKGEAFTYADFTPEQISALKGDKGETGSTPPITSTYGQSATEAVSQKLLTDAVGDIESLLISINGV